MIAEHREQYSIGFVTEARYDVEHLLPWMLLGPGLHPPTQEATAVKLWRNAQRVFSDPSARAYGRRAEALAKEDTLRWVPPKTQKGPRL